MEIPFSHVYLEKENIVFLILSQSKRIVLKNNNYYLFVITWQQRGLSNLPCRLFIYIYYIETRQKPTQTIDISTILHNLASLNFML